MPDDMLRALFRHAEDNMLAQAYINGCQYFPLDNVFLNLRALLPESTEAGGIGVLAFRMYAACTADGNDVWFTRKWRDGLEAWKQRVQSIQSAAAGALTSCERMDTLNFRAHFDALYHPHKHMVHQFARLLADAMTHHRPRLEELRCMRAARACVSAGSMPLGADRPDLPTFVAQVDALAAKVYDAEAAVRRVQPKRACRA